MKKFMTFIAIFAFVFSLAGCNKTEQRELAVYSFSGANEQLSVTNGVIVLSEENDIFYGGNLEVSKDFFSNITSYSTAFYIQSGDERDIVLSNSVEDMTGNTINVSGSLGKVSGDGIIIGTKADDTNDLKNNLYFELSTTDKDGEKGMYQLQMLLTEVTKEAATNE